MRPLLLGALVLLLASLAAAQATEFPVNATCTLESEKKVVCDGKAFHEPEGPLSPKGALFWIYLFLAIFLVLMGGCMSGLTIGLLSLDVLRMDVVMKSGSPTDRKYAARILPLLKRRHLLLVVLLLTNAACMEALPLFLDKIVPEFAAILISVTAVLFFGEIIPQALCVRFSLAIGGNMFWLPWFLIFLEFPIAWPIAKLLDVLLGSHTIEYYKHAELKELVSRHGEKAAGSEKLSIDETTIIGGALEMRNKTVNQVMTPVDKVFMLDQNLNLDARVMQMILQNGHSRVPVYDKDPNRMQGLILVKELLGVSANENRPLTSILLHPMPAVKDTTVLMDMLNEFQLGHSHLASVFEEQADGSHRTVGIVTLEDVLEELLQEEILDEHDHLRAHKLKHGPPAIAAGGVGSAARLATSQSASAAPAQAPQHVATAIPAVAASPMPMKMKGVFKNVPAERKLSAPISGPPQLAPAPAPAPVAPAPGALLVPLGSSSDAAPASPPREPIEPASAERAKKEKKHKKDKKKAGDAGDMV